MGPQGPTSCDSFRLNVGTGMSVSRRVTSVLDRYGKALQKLRFGNSQSLKRLHYLVHFFLHAQCSRILSRGSYLMFAETLQEQYRFGQGDSG